MGFFRFKKEEADPEYISKSGLLGSPTYTGTLRYVPAKGLTPAPTLYATAHITTVQSARELFLTDDIIKLIVDMIHLQGRRSLESRADVDATNVKANIWLLILPGLYRSRSESTRSLWDDYMGQPIFRATMSHSKFAALNSKLRSVKKSWLLSAQSGRSGWSPSRLFLTLARMCAASAVQRTLWIQAVYAQQARQVREKYQDYL